MAVELLAERSSRESAVAHLGLGGRLPAQNEVDHSSNGIGAVERRNAGIHDLYVVDRRKRDTENIGERACRAAWRQPPAIHEDQCRPRAQSSQVGSRTERGVGRRLPADQARILRRAAAEVLRHRPQPVHRRLDPLQHEVGDSEVLLADAAHTHEVATLALCRDAHLRKKVRELRVQCERHRNDVARLSPSPRLPGEHGDRPRVRELEGQLST